ncbi:MAG: hypothetical protein R2793_04750 [Flavobacteriaceae bacterium]
MINKIPITLGVIGHLDTIFTEEHKVVIVNILEKLSRLYPNSPIALFSQLAKGADIEVAKVFLECKEQTKIDFRLIVPLPYEKEELINQLTDSEKIEFKNILSQATKTFTLENLENLPKNELYRNAGKFVADSSLILIALYENEDNNKKGGTADIVRYKIEGTFNDDIEEHIFDNKGSLIIIPCNRVSSDIKIFHLENDYLENLLKDKSISKALDKIDASNKEVQKFSEIELESSANDLYPANKSLIEQNQQLKRLYSIFDTIAQKQQKRYLNLIKALFLLGLLILSVFEIYKHLGLNPIFFGGTLTLIGIAYFIYKRSHKVGSHTKYLEDRIIAEALRVQFFWNVSDIKMAAANYILRIHKTEFNWVKHILLSIYGLTYNWINTRDESIKDVKTHWIINQKDFFELRLSKLEKNERLFNLLSKIIFWIALAVLALIFILEYKHFNHHIIHLLIVVDSVLFGLFALIKAYYEKRGFEQIRNQYTLMSIIYSACETKMNEIILNEISKEQIDKQLDKLLFLTGKEALIENGNWYLIFKEKEPEVEGIGG